MQQRTERRRLAVVTALAPDRREDRVGLECHKSRTDREHNQVCGDTIGDL